MKNAVNFRDKILLISWISGLLIIITLIWILTQSLQANILLRGVNNVFSNNGDSRRLSANISGDSHLRSGGKAGIFGYWYSIQNSTDKMFVFAVFQDGILCPLGIIMSANGNAKEIIPLSSHAVQIFDNIPQSILQMYVKRIEGI